MRTITKHMQGILLWDDLVKLEPALQQMMEEVLVMNREQDEDEKHRFWYDEIKPGLMQVVGWCRPNRHAVLSSEEAYEVAYHALNKPLFGE